MFLLLAAPTSAPSCRGINRCGLALEDLKAIYRAIYDVMQSGRIVNPIDLPQIKHLKKLLFLYLDSIQERIQVLEQQPRMDRASAVFKFVIVQADPANGVEEVSEKWCSDFTEFGFGYYKILAQANYKSGYDEKKIAQLVSLLQYEICFQVGNNGRIQEPILGKLLHYWFILSVSDSQLLSAGEVGDIQGVPNTREQPPPTSPDNAAWMKGSARNW